MTGEDVLMSVPGVLRSAGREPGRIENSLRRMERVGQSAEQLAALRARDQHLVSLIGRAAQGDEMALRVLYDETSSLVYSLVMRILRDQFAAEEVTIDVYAQAYRQAPSYDPGRGAPSAWLLMMARSRALDRLRAESRRRNREQPLETAAAIPSTAVDPEAWSAAADQRRAVQAALAVLTPEQRQAIEMAYYSGLSHSEIAARLGQPLGTVKTRIRTGMILLREQLQPLLEGGQSCNI